VKYFTAVVDVSWVGMCALMLVSFATDDTDKSRFTLGICDLPVKFQGGRVMLTKWDSL
jgi:hypothetical protein